MWFSGKKTNKSERKPKYTLGLALSGGGARGLAHLGFLKVLEREKIKVDYLSGTSMGSIIAASYARGMDLSEMEAEILQATTTRSMMRLVNVAPPTRGFLEVGKVRTLLTRFIPEALTFADLKIPLAVCATDLIHATSITLDQGEVLSAVMASCAVPGIFPAMNVPPYTLVDGGVLNNLPVDLVKKLGAKKTIAVDVQLNPFETIPWDELPVTTRMPLHIPTTIKDVLWSAMMMSARITQVNMQITPPDLYINTRVPRGITMFMGFQKAAEIIAEGEKSAEENLPAIRKLLRI
jgi:NTE family protein